MTRLLSPHSGFRYRRKGSVTGWSGMAAIAALEPVIPVLDFTRPRTSAASLELCPPPAEVALYAIPSPRYTRPYSPNGTAA
ncbi:hypothetical protein [Streptomyces sp.]|uniref:hypothetical protein n=1 Tax=Streptomyces sp. TaxID=1931 RepID=UPI002F93FD04